MDENVKETEVIEKTVTAEQPSTSEVKGKKAQGRSLRRGTYEREFKSGEIILRARTKHYTDS